MFAVHDALNDERFKGRCRPARLAVTVTAVASAGDGNEAMKTGPKRMMLVKASCFAGTVSSGSRAISYFANRTSRILRLWLRRARETTPKDRVVRPAAAPVLRPEP